MNLLKGTLKGLPFKKSNSNMGDDDSEDSWVPDRDPPKRTSINKANNKGKERTYEYGDEDNNDGDDDNDYTTEAANPQTNKFKNKDVAASPRQERDTERRNKNDERNNMEKRKEEMEEMATENDELSKMVKKSDIGSGSPTTVGTFSDTGRPRRSTAGGDLVDLADMDGSRYTPDSSPPENGHRRPRERKDSASKPPKDSPSFNSDPKNKKKNDTGEKAKDNEDNNNKKRKKYQTCLPRKTKSKRKEKEK